MHAHTRKLCICATFGTIANFPQDMFTYAPSHHFLEIHSELLLYIHNISTTNSQQIQRNINTHEKGKTRTRVKNETRIENMFVNNVKLGLIMMCDTTAFMWFKLN